MDLEVFSPTAAPSRPRDLVKCCNCGCSCSLVASSSPGSSWLRSVKRKFDEFEEGNRFFIPGFDLFSNPRVQIENECAALRETVSSQQQAIQDLYAELEEERNASSSAANEAMSMILRLQREKAEIQMESRQFKRFAEEKMAHDQQELLALEDILYKREQAIQSLTCEVQAYKHRMLSYGLTEAEVEGDKGERSGFSRNPSMAENLDAAQFEFPLYDYPPLKCSLNENPNALEAEGDDDVVDVEKYAFGETPRPRDHLKNLEYRINQMEKSPSSSQLDGEPSSAKNILEKVIVGHSPRLPRHNRVFSGDSSNSFMGMPREAGPDIANESPRFKFSNSFKKMDYVTHSEDHSNLRRVDNASDFGDDMSDRVYTIDSIHNGVPSNGFTEPKPGVGISEDYISTPRDILNRPDVSDPDIKKLYMRLQALEADRESMRQAIISMRTDKAQMVLLKEIAQHLSKEMSPERRMPVKKPSIVGTFSFMSIFKWIISFIFWRKKARRSRYMCGLSATNVGLLLLLDKGPRTRQWRCLTSTQV
ncbi:myosin-binding protein 7 [Ricinus communis]|uniref:myosin-binding protein 7 n=1 Tax=Ricinus communis TaxID=3988 RepID=UPI0007725B32|nr:myosin-binding protein 7 [Ricinus communis]XP_015577827.1 myosin-binding protein 7 [Ricinus communis]|eukprot:XP_015577826.1 myosin-binding protein 7 [Ricinus communis]